MEKLKIGFIGQGWIGKNYADDFEKRGYDVVRYALEEPYNGNGKALKACDIIFIAVPTPSKPEGFDASILKTAIKSVGKGKTAVIKSTLLPGITEEIQKENPEIFVFHSPEFLSEATAALDAANPKRNIIGMPVDNEEYREKAKLILSALPKAPFELICNAREAELIKYGGNNWFYFKVVYINLLYDLASKNGASWEVIRDAMSADPRIGKSHLNPVHKSGTLGGDAYNLQSEDDKDGGRGAGGHCFIKDFAAFREIYQKKVGDEPGIDLLKSMEKKNIDLLLKSDKDLYLLEGVYGKSLIQNHYSTTHNDIKRYIHEYVRFVFAVTQKFPENDFYGLISQFRRTAISIMLSYVKSYIGAYKSKNMNYSNFLEKSYGSLRESRYLLYFSFDFKFINKEDYKKGIELSDKIDAMILPLIKKT